MFKRIKIVLLYYIILFSSTCVIAETTSQKQGLLKLDDYIAETDKYMRSIEIEKLKTKLNSLKIQNKEFQDKLGDSLQKVTPLKVISASNNEIKQQKNTSQTARSSSSISKNKYNKEQKSNFNQAKKKQYNELSYNEGAAPSSYNLVKVYGFDDNLRAVLDIGDISFNTHVGQVLFGQYKILEIHENYVKIENILTSTYKKIYIKSSNVGSY